MTITRFFVILSAAPLTLAHHKAANDNEQRIANYVNLQSFKKGTQRSQKPN